MHAGGTERHHCNVYPRIVHERDACFFGPLKRRESSDRSIRVLGRLPEKIRQKVVVRVDRQRRGIRSVSHGKFLCRQPRIILAARPAIMWVIAFVPGPEMMCGATEASATRKPKMPRTRSSGSTTARSSMPILQVPTP